MPAAASPRTLRCGWYSWYPYQYTEAEHGVRATTTARTPAVATVEDQVRASVQERAKAAVARVNALPGVAACAITFADGLALAGKLPSEIGAAILAGVHAALASDVKRMGVGRSVVLATTWAEC